MIGVRVKIAKLEIFDDCEVAIRMVPANGEDIRPHQPPTSEIEMNDTATWTDAAEPAIESAPGTEAAEAQKKAAKIEREDRKLEKRLCREVGRAIADYNMIEEGDRVMVCLSGGKDSYGLLDILMKLQARAPVRFELIAVNLDQKQPGFPDHILPEYLKSSASSSTSRPRTPTQSSRRSCPRARPCAACSRLRRGILYRVAKELGCTKIALGHHRDDILQTFFLNMFFGAKLRACRPAGQRQRRVHGDPPARLRAREGPDPLGPGTRVPDHPLHALRQPGRTCSASRSATCCANGEKKFPGRIESMLGALQNVVPSHLMDRELHLFQTLRTTGIADENGDMVFDEEELPMPPSPAGRAGHQPDAFALTNRATALGGSRGPSPAHAFQEPAMPRAFAMPRTGACRPIARHLAGACLLAGILLWTVERLRRRDPARERCAQPRRLDAVGQRRDIATGARRPVSHRAPPLAAPGPFSAAGRDRNNSARCARSASDCARRRTAAGRPAAAALDESNSGALDPPAPRPWDEARPARLRHAPGAGPC